MQRIAGVLCPVVAGADVEPAGHLQAGIGDPLQQLCTRPQAEVLGQVRQDQPALAARRQVGPQPGQKAAQHAAVGVVHGGFQR